MSLGDPPIRKPAEPAPERPDEQVRPGVYRRPDGTMYTKGLAPGNVPPKPKPEPCEYDEWLGACWNVPILTPPPQRAPDPPPPQPKETP